jgi:hypothetical protein
MSEARPATFLPKRFAADSGQILAGLMLFIAVLKLVAVFVYVPGDRSIYDLGFSFDPYVRSLHEGRGFVSCEESACDHSSRMPGLPVFLAAISTFTTSLRVAAIIKALLFSVLIFLACRGLGARLIARAPAHFAFYAAVIGFLTLAPNLVKHASVAHYEEGYVLELLAIVAISVMMLLSGNLRDASWSRFVAPVLAASVAYLFKSSLILVWAATSAIVVYAAFAGGRRAIAAGMIALALAAPVLWLIHNYTTGHRVSVMSSYDGENMFRGWNSHTLELYPRCSLDMLFEPIRICEDKRVELPTEPGRAGFDSEWAWNDAYKRRATDWIIQNPSAALKTLGVKLYTVLVSPRLVPYRMTDGPKEKSRGRAEEIIGSAWLAIGRLLELFGLMASLWLIWRGDARARRVAVASLFLTASYATPYVLGFGYERHFSIFVMLVAICSLFLFAELVRLARDESHHAPQKAIA